MLKLPVLVLKEKDQHKNRKCQECTTVLFQGRDIDHKAVPGLMAEMKPPHAMDFIVVDQAKLKTLKPGQAVTAHVRKQGRDYVLDDLRPIPTGKVTKR